MLTEFKEHIRTNFSFLKDKKILVANSGGLDSSTLTRLLNQSELQIELAHCNFRLRGKDSDNDEQFVKDLAKKLNIKCYTKQFNTEEFANKNNVSIQMAARQLRYDWFYELLAENNLDYIVTAHHLDDSLETFILNFSRGTGLNGLTGIPEVNGKIIRPLLQFSRKQIEAFAQATKLVWREDSSNAETKYKRNKIRHQVISLLKEINPSLLDTFKQTTAHLQQSRDILNDTILELKKRVVIPVQAGIHKINIQKIKELSHPKAYLYEILKEYGFKEWDDVVNLLDAQSGKQLFSETHRLVKDREHFLLESRTTQIEKESLLIFENEENISKDDFFLSIITTKNIGDLNQNLVHIDKDKLQFPLKLRKWKQGDYFYPFGMNGKKKLSKFFKDEKFSLIDKENTWLLCSNEDIVWVVNKRLDNRFKITDKTQNILQIVFKKKQ